MKGVFSLAKHVRTHCPIKRRCRGGLSLAAGRGYNGRAAGGVPSEPRPEAGPGQREDGGVASLRSRAAHRSVPHLYISRLADSR